MLSIGKLGSDPDPAAYYLEVVASGVEDYYLSAEEVPAVGSVVPPAAWDSPGPSSPTTFGPYSTAATRTRVTGSAIAGRSPASI